MRKTLLILFLMSILPLFGQENDTLKFTPKFVTGSVERIQVETSGGSAWITIDGDSTEYEFDPPDRAPSKNNNTRDADRTTTRKDTSLSLELSNRYRTPLENNNVRDTDRRISVKDSLLWWQLSHRRYPCSE